MAIEEHPLILEIRCLAREGARKRLPYGRPRRSPALAEVLAHGVRVFPSADGPVAVVIDLHMLGTPRQRDGEIRAEAEADGGAQALGPRPEGAEWRLGPVHRSHELAHLSAADEPVCGVHLLSSEPRSECGV